MFVQPPTRELRGTLYCVQSDPGHGCCSSCRQDERDGGLALMRGVITTKDVAENLMLIYREFGFFCVLRCVAALLRGRPTTFLDVAVGSDFR